MELKLPSLSFPGLDSQPCQPQPISHNTILPAVLWDPMLPGANLQTHKLRDVLCQAFLTGII